MKSLFMKELEHNQEVFINSLLLSDKGNSMQSFYCEYLKIPIIIDEATYLIWKSDIKVNLFIQGVSSKLGVYLSLSHTHISLTVQFPYKGFYCYRDFYGELRRQVVNRIQIEFGNKIILNDDTKEVYITHNEKRRKAINKMLFDDLGLN